METDLVSSTAVSARHSVYNYVTHCGTDVFNVKCGRFDMSL